MLTGLVLSFVTLIVAGARIEFEHARNRREPTYVLFVGLAALVCTSYFAALITLGFAA